jgi:hypothetical protein
MLLNHVDVDPFHTSYRHLRVFLLKTIYANARSLDKEVKQ